MVTPHMMEGITMTDKLDITIMLLLFIGITSLCVISIQDNISTREELFKIANENKDIRNAISGLEERQLYNDTLASTTVAQYRPDTQTIQLFTIKDNLINETEQNFYHELGHKVWYEYISKEDKSKYALLFETCNCFVSDYSRTSLIESFAEDYAYYRMNLSGVNKDKVTIMEKYR
jgi:hypothetical protein